MADKYMILLKKRLFIITAIIFFSLSINRLESQELKDITLPEPDTTSGLTLMKTLKLRASANQFDTTSIKLQDISNLLWAANGINRSTENKRTAPSALNAQDIDIFVFIKSGIYLYSADKYLLKQISISDHRYLFLQKSQKTDPPLICLLVSDISRFKFGNDSLRLEWAAMDAGMISQNISLFCSSFGFATRPRASMDKKKLKELLKLKESQYIFLNHPVSYNIFRHEK